MRTTIVPASYVFEFARQRAPWEPEITKSLSLYLIEKLYEFPDPAMKRDGTNHFFSFDNIDGDSGQRIEVTGWIGENPPSEITSWDRFIPVSMIRNLYCARPVFTEMFNTRDRKPLFKGHEAGVFSSVH